MKMLTRAFNTTGEMEQFVNANGISKDNIVNVFQRSDKTYQLIYYAEED